MAKYFNDFFVNIGNMIEEKIPPGNAHFSTFLKKDNNDVFVIQPVDEKEIKSMILQLNTSKSCGPNSIPSKLLRDKGYPTLVNYLNVLCTQGCTNFLKNLIFFMIYNLAFVRKIQLSTHFLI